MTVRIWEQVNPWNAQRPLVLDIRCTFQSANPTASFQQFTTNAKTTFIIVQADENVRICIGTLADGTENNNAYFLLPALETREFEIKGGEKVGYRTG